MSSVFANLNRFIPMQATQDARASAQLNAARTNLQAAGTAAKSAKNAQSDAQLKRACTEFEALFVKQMLDAMRKTVNQKNDLIQPDLATNIFQGMLYDEYARKMAEVGHFGIAQMLYNQFTEKTIQPNQ